MFASMAQIPEVSPAEEIGGEFADVLAICPVAEDHVRLHEILRGRDLRLIGAATWREGAGGLARHQPRVVICEAVLPDADWKEVLALIAIRTDAPKLIVISRLADESRWAEVLNLGGYDVLPKPLVHDEVVRVVGLAWQSWNSEKERQEQQPESLSRKENSK